jgi:hypothetical protein
MGRKTALYRILLVIPLIIYNYLLAILSLFLFVPLGILDVIWQGIAGGDGFAGEWADTWFRWHVDNTLFVLTSDGDWEWTP